MRKVFESICVGLLMTVLILGMGCACSFLATGWMNFCSSACGGGNKAFFLAILPVAIGIFAWATTSFYNYDKRYYPDD